MYKKNYSLLILLLLFQFSFAQNWTVYNSTNGLGSGLVRAISSDTTGNVWAAKSTGLLKFDGAVWTTYTTTSTGGGMVSNITTAVTGDRSGAIWLGYSTNGIARFDGTSWTTYTTSNGLIKNNIKSLFCSSNNDLWIAADTGISLLRNGVFTNFNVSNGLTFPLVRDFIEDDNGTIWIAHNKGVSKFNGTSFTHIILSPDSIPVNCLAKDNLGNILIGTNGRGIYVFYGGGFLNIGNSEGLTNLTIRDIATNSNNDYAIATSAGVFVRRGTNIISIGAQQGLAIASSVFFVFSDKSGKSWFSSASTTNGIYVLNNLSELNKSSDRLAINNISAYLSPVFAFGDGASPGFEVPKGSGKNTIFAKTTWMGGIDAGQQLHVAAETYRQSGADFFPGPVSNSAGYVTAETNKWNRVWKVSRVEIERHRTQYMRPTYIMPRDIAQWPAHGNVALGQSYNLAPFFDSNNNNLYDPENGDYPLIRGDETIFFITNDDRSNHTESGGLKFGVEFHHMYYSFKCSSNDLNNTIFENIKIYNRSANNYFEVYYGLFTDFDLGNYSDDFVGCDVGRSLFYAYNGSNSDAIYGSGPPVQGIDFLKGPLANPGDGVDNDHDGTTDEPGETCTLSNFMYYVNTTNNVNGNPTTPYNYYNYLRSYFRDSTHLTDGGSGIGGATPTNFFCPGSTNTGFSDWTEINSFNLPGDRRGLGSCGPFTLNSGTMQELDIAYIYAGDPATDNIQNITRLGQASDFIQNISSNASFNNVYKSIFGFVSNNSGIPLSNGKADLFLVNQPGFVLPVKTSTISGGTYFFSEVMEGTYKVLLTPDSVQYFSTLPRIYSGNINGTNRNTVRWDSAMVYQADCLNDTIYINTTIYPFNVGNGTGNISGYILNDGSFGNFKTSRQGDPLPGVDISLEQNPGSSLRAVTSTDSTGKFVFANLPNGDYTLIPDISGLSLVNTIGIPITVSNLVSNDNLFYVGDTTIYVPANVGIKTIQRNEIHYLKVYPNPVIDELRVQLSETDLKDGIVSIEVFDLTGRKMNSAILQNELNRIDYSFLMQGMYIFNFSKNGNIISSGKFVKN